MAKSTFTDHSAMVSKLSAFCYLITRSICTKIRSQKLLAGILLEAYEVLSFMMKSRVKHAASAVILSEDFSSQKPFIRSFDLSRAERNCVS
jgi:hypothetical protein